MTKMIAPIPFFAGHGLDRADALRADPAAIAEVARSSDARELVWIDGLPSILADGSLEWRPVENPELFLGFADGAARFSLVPEQIKAFRSAASLLGGLSASEAPVFAAALSLAAWHLAHPFCSKCGGQTRSVRGGWSRRCEACAVEHFPRVDPVVIMLAHNEDNVILGRQPQFPAGRYTAL